MEPFRAFVGDNLPEKQRTLGFSMQSFFIGAGAVVGSALPYIFTNWFNMPNTAPKGIIAPSVKWSFYIGGIVFLLAVLWTVFNSKEYTPEELEKFEKNKEPNLNKIENSQSLVPFKKQWNYGILLTIIGLIALSYVYYINRINNSHKELYILAIWYFFLSKNI